MTSQLKRRSQAVNTLKLEFTKESRLAKIQKALGNTLAAETFVNVAMTALKHDSKVLECTVESIIECCMEAAYYKVQIGGPRPEAVLIPRKLSGVQTCTLQLQYQAYKRLARNHPTVQLVDMDCIRQGDTFRWDGPTKPLVVTKSKSRTRMTDPVDHAYCTVHFQNGSQLTRMWTVEECKPFFVNVWLHEPHTPHHTIPKYLWRFPDLDEPDNIYAAILSHADDRVGEILDALDRLGLTDNTLVVFSSDNGPAGAAGELSLFYDSATGAGYGRGASKGTTGGRKGYKASLFEGGIGVPFIVRWPGKVPAGKVDDVSLMSAVDLLPTFCEVAGVELPSDYQPDGISQVPTLKGKKYPSRTKPLFWKYPSRWPASDRKPDHWVSFAVVDQTWKLVSNKDLSYVELYDIASDAYEKDDLKQQHPDIVRHLLEQLKAWQHTLPAKPEGNVFSDERN